MRALSEVLRISRVCDFVERDTEQGVSGTCRHPQRGSVCVDDGPIVISNHRTVDGVEQGQCRCGRVAFFGGDFRLPALGLSIEIECISNYFW